jgi:hypothetical protein
MYFITFCFYDELKFEKPYYERVMTKLSPKDWAEQYYSETGYQIKILDIDAIESHYCYGLQNNNYVFI